MSSGPDPTLGFFLTYVLISLALGPYNPSLYLSAPEAAAATPASTPSTKAENILHKVKEHIGSGGNAGWHGTFAWSAVVVFVVVLLDWILARRARAKTRQRTAQRQYHLHEDSDSSDDEYGEELHEEDDHYYDEEDEYELVHQNQSRTTRSNGGHCHAGDDGPAEEMLLLDCDVQQVTRPSFVLVVDPPSRCASPSTNDNEGQ